MKDQPTTRHRGGGSARIVLATLIALLAMATTLIAVPTADAGGGFDAPRLSVKMEPNGLWLEWDRVPGAGGYHYQIEEGWGGVVHTSGNTEDDEVWVNVPRHSYRITVWALVDPDSWPRSGDAGPPSNAVYTANIPGVPDKPTVTCTGVAFAEWNQVPGTRYYDVWFRIDGKASQVWTHGTSKPLAPCESGSRIEVMVRAVGAPGHVGQWSERYQNN